MTKFQSIMGYGEECAGLYGLRNSQEELNELRWLLEKAHNHSLDRGMRRRVTTAIRECEEYYDSGDDEAIEFMRQEAFDLFGELAARHGSVFMYHPDYPGEAVLMTRRWYKKEGFDA